MSKIIKITAFFLFFVMSYTAAYALTYCDNPGQWECCKNGFLSCCDENDTLSATITTPPCSGAVEKPFLPGGGGIINTCSTVGSTQSKYTASGCTYTTSTRECCSNNTWSAWDGECATCTGCTGTKPATSQSCKYGSSTTNNGTQTRSVSCNYDTCKWEAGSWGTCQCNDTCSGSDIFSAAVCKCCWASCYLNSTGTTAGYCNCTATELHYNIANRCCKMTNGQEYRLPSTYSDCSTFAKKIGLTAQAGVAYACLKQF